LKWFFRRWYWWNRESGKEIPCCFNDTSTPSPLSDRNNTIDYRCIFFNFQNFLLLQSRRKGYDMTRETARTRILNAKQPVHKKNNWLFLGAANTRKSIATSKDFVLQSDRLSWVYRYIYLLEKQYIWQGATTRHEKQHAHGFCTTKQPLHKKTTIYFLLLQTLERVSGWIQHTSTEQQKSWHNYAHFKPRRTHRY